jgi:phage terminase large subunit-like protein
MRSPAASLAAMPAEERRAYLDSLSPIEAEQLIFTWKFWARPDQLAPAGEWRTWLLLGGRGSGKTRSAAEWLRQEIEGGRRRQLGIVGPTADAVRRIQVEGPSGILSVAPSWARPTFEPALRRLVWPNGAVAHLFSAEEPDRLRGPNLDGAWVDELCACPQADELWNMLAMAVRVAGPKGDAPQIVVTTTPRPIRVLKEIVGSSSTKVTRARTLDNAANLDAATLKHLAERYGGPTLGRQELEAEMLDQVDGALWSRSAIEDQRVARPPMLKRVVVAVDPAVANGSGDECGIVAAGLGEDGHGYVLADRSGRMSPERWARSAIDLYHGQVADRLIAEANNGGELVRITMRAVDAQVPVRLVHASRGKQARAEPVAALYEQGRVHHVGAFPELEDQLCNWAPLEGGPSPDRLDALVRALTELMLKVRLEDRPRPAMPNVISIYGR